MNGMAGPVHSSDDKLSHPMKGGTFRRYENPMYTSMVLRPIFWVPFFIVEKMEQGFKKAYLRLSVRVLSLALNYFVIDPNGIIKSSITFAVLPSGFLIQDN